MAVETDKIGDDLRLRQRVELSQCNPFYFCILIKVNDIIEILKYVSMGILLLIVEIDTILFTKTNGIELYTNTHV